MQSIPAWARSATSRTSDRSTSGRRRRLSLLSKKRRRGRSNSITYRKSRRHRKARKAYWLAHPDTLIRA
jgi:hypothetical protein